MNNKVIDGIAAAAFVLVLGISGIWGEYERADAGGRKVQASEAKARQTEGSLEEEEKQERGPGLDEKERAVLDEIAQALDKRNLKDAVRVMDREEELLAGLFYETMAGGRYLYNGQELKEEIEGEGMVFTKPGAVFYGSFKNGRPNGRCLVLQAVDLDAPRYDYADGFWQNGKMEGEGHTGYCYYENVPGDEARDVCRKGRFSGDLMEGEVTYKTANDKDEESTWKFTVTGGAVEIDDKWIYLEDRQEYQLMSLDSDSHAYIMGRDQIGQSLWANRLVWEE